MTKNVVTKTAYIYSFTVPKAGSLKLASLGCRQGVSRAALRPGALEKNSFLALCRFWWRHIMAYGCIDLTPNSSPCKSLFALPSVFPVRLVSLGSPPIRTCMIATRALLGNPWLPIVCKIL